MLGYTYLDYLLRTKSHSYYGRCPACHSPSADSMGGFGLSRCARCANYFSTYHDTLDVQNTPTETTLKRAMYLAKTSAQWLRNATAEVISKIRKTQSRPAACTALTLALLAAVAHQGGGKENSSDTNQNGAVLMDEYGAAMVPAWGTAQTKIDDPTEYDTGFSASRFGDRAVDRGVRFGRFQF